MLRSPAGRCKAQARAALPPTTRPRPAGSCACAASTSAAANAEFESFKHAAGKHNLVPLYTRIAGDQLTPVTAYRRLVSADDREAPSYLFESVQNGTDTGRYSFVGAHPALEVLAKENTVTILDHEAVRCCPVGNNVMGSHAAPGRHRAAASVCTAFGSSNHTAVERKRSVRG